MNDNEITKSAGQYNFKMDKIEKGVSAAALLIFLLSMTQQESMLWTIIFFVFTSVVLIYYFVWYRRKPAYVIIKDESVLVNNPPFYQPYEIEKQQIGKIVASDKKIDINYKDQGTSKSISLYSIMLSNDDWKLMAAELKRLNK